MQRYHRGMIGLLVALAVIGLYHAITAGEDAPARQFFGAVMVLAAMFGLLAVIR